ASADADAAEPLDAVAHPGGADPRVPALAAGPVRLRDHLHSLLYRWPHRLFRRLSRPGSRADFAARPVPRPDRRQDHGRRGADHADLQPQGEPRAGDRRAAHHRRIGDPAARDHGLGPARIPCRAAGLRPGERARQMEDDLAAGRARCADPERRRARPGLDPQRRSRQPVGRRRADPRHRLRLPPHRTPPHGL
ncbi:MAG: CDP-diacylglycerol--glycerol-3-phosphate 3-phosphatidyltransferase, partial [uncultured Sphingomonas sp.]